MNESHCKAFSSKAIDHFVAHNCEIPYPCRRKNQAQPRSSHYTPDTSTALKHADAAMCVGKQNGKRRLHRVFTLQTG